MLAAEAMRRSSFKLPPSPSHTLTPSHSPGPTHHPASIRIYHPGYTACPLLPRGRSVWPPPRQPRIWGPRWVPCRY
eukprot:scaffold13372_cov112-Isochrysis_galbana.AAC.2